MSEQNKSFNYKVMAALKMFVIPKKGLIRLRVMAAY